MNNSKTMKNIRLAIMSVLVLVVGGYLVNLGSTPFDIFTKKPKQVETPVPDTPSIDIGKIKVSEFNDTMKLQAALEKKAKLEEKVTLQNDTYAMIEIGEMYIGETLGAPDLKQAKYWLKKAADAGNADAASRVQDVESIQRTIAQYTEQTTETGPSQEAQDLMKEIEALLESAEELSSSMTEDFKGISNGLETVEIADKIESEFLETPPARPQTLSGTPLMGLGELLDPNNDLQKQAAAEKLEHLNGMTLEALEALANTGDALAQNQLGLKYNNIELDRTTALKWFMKAADGGFDEGIINADKMIEYPEISDTDRATMIVWMQKLGEQERAPAQLLLGNYYNAGVHGLPKDKEIGHAWLEKSAENGLAEAQYKIGFAQIMGAEIPKNQKSGVAWLRKSAAQGNINGQYWLGRAYDQGYAGERNYKLALKWYEKALKGGYKSVDLDILNVYRNERSSEHNLTKARKIIEAMIAKDNRAVAHLYAGDMYLEGKGYPQSDELALEHYFIAAGQGYGAAQYKFAIMLLEGRGTEKNEKVAIQWLREANANFNYDASVKLKELGILTE